MAKSYTVAIDGRRTWVRERKSRHGESTRSPETSGSHFYCLNPVFISKKDSSQKLPCIVRHSLSNMMPMNSHRTTAIIIVYFTDDKTEEWKLIFQDHLPKKQRKEDSQDSRALGTVASPQCCPAV